MIRSLLASIALVSVAGMAAPSYNGQVNRNKSYDVADAGAFAVYTTPIQFSGYEWRVKTSYGGRVGPGPNYFSDSEDNVWVDAEGRLHLRITKDKKAYNCAEVISVQSFGYGTYRWYLDTAVETLDRNVVLGLFTWSDDSPFYNGEIDLEFSRWGTTYHLNSQYVVQPWDEPGHLVTFEIPPGLPETTHSFSWDSAFVYFESLAGHDPDDGSALLQQWLFEGSVPPFTNENARMNLGLYQGKRPTSKDGGLEVIIRDFEFVPFAP